MKITTSQFKRCDVLHITDRVDSSTAPQMNTAIESLLESGRYHIILDLAGVTFMSSAGLRVMINAQKACKQYNRGQVVLAAVPANIYSALDLAGFIPLFSLFPDVTTAVGSF
ncbi:MAG: STAS domain-containing protein [Leptolinea sp.]|jgi:anti-anti-sigma factor|nr:STAS domain-containing protein [Leptolinea sp.]